MIKNKYFITAGVLYVFISQVSAQLSGYRGHDSTLEELITNYNSFALGFFQRLTHKVKNTSNFMVSPFPIWTLLLVTAEGATDRTLSQLKTTLGIGRHFDVISEYFEQLESALNITSIPGNTGISRTVFSDMDKNVKHTFEKTAQISYKTAAIPVIYRLPTHSKDFINTYISTDTNGLIESTIDEHDLLEANLILFSSTFFRGQWKFPFRKVARIFKFVNENGQPLGNVSMMCVEGTFPNFKIRKIKLDVLELPLGNEDTFSMIVFLPGLSTPMKPAIEYIVKEGLASILNKLNKAAKRNPHDTLGIFLPQVTTTTDFQLNSIFEEMGIVDAFDATKAKFPNISNNGSYVSNIFHQTLIEVSTDGSSVPANRCASPRIRRKLANRPFFYLIVNKLSKSLLLCGQVTQPSLLNE